ncbi:unnamed protein product [Cochlearia groenlandica]
MLTIGEFRVKEIDGNPFYIFTYLSQTDKDLRLDQPLFLCPTFRLRAENSQPDNRLNPSGVSPHFPTTRSDDVDPQIKLKLGRSYYGNCNLPLTLTNKDLTKEQHSSIVCDSCKMSLISNSDLYFCEICDSYFHKECVESPLIFKHPSHPFTSFQLYVRPTYCFEYWECVCCEKPITSMGYYFSTNKISMHPLCALKPIPIVIDQPKRHPHPLTFFPKQAFLPCNVCGLIKEFIPTYVCVRCVFVVHQDCIYSPYVIRISRHHHRISFTFSLPSGKLSCGVCRQKVDNNCGAYSCGKCDGYFVHSRCALRGDLWDGEELEGVLEEPEIVVEPFEMIADGIILHFSHDHLMKLEISRVYNESKICQACVLPIYEGSYYSCMNDQCDFILHEICASAPLKKHHPLHSRPLMLTVVTDGYENQLYNKGYFTCSACNRESRGFVYEDRTRDLHFTLDLRCASVSEPFNYQGHKHPLFLNLTPEEEKSAVCKICHGTSEESMTCSKLNCIECDYTICFECATLPYKAKYKHDKHYLTFQEEKKEKDYSDWCEACERKISDSTKYGYYSCNECCTTLHIDCLLGADMYMKPGQMVKDYFDVVDIIRNNTTCRPSCLTCQKRCQHKVVFTLLGVENCSISCLKSLLPQWS